MSYPHYPPPSDPEAQPTGYPTDNYGPAPSYGAPTPPPGPHPRRTVASPPPAQQPSYGQMPGPYGPPPGVGVGDYVHQDERQTGDAGQPYYGGNMHNMPDAGRRLPSSHSLSPHPQAQQQPYYDVHGAPNFPQATPLGDLHEPGQDPFQEDLDTPLLHQTYAHTGQAPLGNRWEQEQDRRQDERHYQDNAGERGYDAGGTGYTDGRDDASMVRYGRIPQRQPRRYKTVKRELSSFLKRFDVQELMYGTRWWTGVNLYHGNLVRVVAYSLHLGNY